VALDGSRNRCIAVRPSSLCGVRNQLEVLSYADVSHARCATKQQVTRGDTPAPEGGGEENDGPETLVPEGEFGGVDGTRTRDLRRDRRTK
jgi:hypothetical protein